MVFKFIPEESELLLSSIFELKSELTILFIFKGILEYATMPALKKQFF